MQDVQTMVWQEKVHCARQDEGRHWGYGQQVVLEQKSGGCARISDGAHNSDVFCAGGATRAELLNSDTNHARSPMAIKW